MRSTEALLLLNDAGLERVVFPGGERIREYKPVMPNIREEDQVTPPGYKRMLEGVAPVTLASLNESEDLSRPRIMIPRRGISIFAPAQTAILIKAAAKSRENGTKVPASVHVDNREKARLHLIKNDKIMANRYPTPELGHALMESVDLARRDELMKMAYDLKDHVVLSWETIDREKPIAVLLFGSIARGLVRGPSHPDPSNIDMTVLGDISLTEQNQLFDIIRPKRLEIQTRILGGCDVVSSTGPNPGNAGVSITTPEKLRKSGYGLAREYISGNGLTLHDPAGIWSQIEGEALDYHFAKMERQRRSNAGILPPSK